MDEVLINTTTAGIQGRAARHKVHRSEDGERPILPSLAS
jgi:hypothetical protein